MKNKKLLLIASLVLALTMSLGGTLAYLTDTDEAVNVMTLGNVDIEQIEQERGEGNALVEITDTENMGPLYPAVGEIGNEDDNGYWTGVHGAVDKVVTVKNVGSSPAYVRTFFAFEADANFGLEHIKINWNDAVGTETEDKWHLTEMENLVTIDGVNYVVYLATLKDALPAAKATSDGTEITVPSLMQVAMDGAATNEYVASFGNEYTIKVLTQAVQTNNMTEAYNALTEAEQAKYNSAADYALQTAFDGLDNPFEGSSLKIAEVNTVDTFYAALRDTSVNVIKMAAGEYDFTNEQIRYSYLPADKIHSGGTPEGAETLDGNANGINFWHPVQVVGAGVDATKIKVGGTPNGMQYFILVNSHNVSLSNLSIENASVSPYANKRTILVMFLEKTDLVENFTLENVQFSGNCNNDVKLDKAKNAVMINVTTKSKAYKPLDVVTGSNCTGTITKIK